MMPQLNRAKVWLISALTLLSWSMAEAKTRVVDQSAPIQVELKSLIGSRESGTNVEICQGIFRVHNHTAQDIALQFTAIPQDILGYRIEAITEQIRVDEQVGTGELSFEQIPAGKSRQNALYLRGISCDIVYMQIAIEAICQDIATRQPCTSGISYVSSVRDSVGAPRPIVANGYRYDPKNLNKQVVQLLMKHPELRQDLELALQNGTALHKPPESNIIIDVENEVIDLTINGDASSDQLLPDEGLPPYHPDRFTDEGMLLNDDGQYPYDQDLPPPMPMPLK